LPSEAVAVRCEHVVRTYRSPTGEVRALRDVSAVFSRGLVTAVVGPSGSGKSSLLRLIAGMDRPTSGTLTVEGRDVAGGSAAARRRLRRDVIGYVYQRPSDNFFPHLTLAEHLRSAARGNARRSSDPSELLDRLGLGHRADHLPFQLSGGEQQRAAFAQVLATGARIIVADEPTAELDSAFGEDLLGRVRDLSEQGVTFLLATHDPRVISAAHERLELEHGVVKGGGVASPTTGGDAAPIVLRWPDPWVPPWLRDDEPVLRLRRVEKAYGTGEDVVHALRGVDLDAGAGEVVGLMGRSGSGKTTLLNVAAGWEAPDSGVVSAPGGEEPDWAEVAVMPQRLGLMEELSTQENVEYPARMAGSLEQRRGLVEDLLEALGLSALRARYPRETSLGEQQRTALARALVMSPRLLIADEPTGHQDAGWVLRIMQILREAANAGTCCVIATHDVDLAPHLEQAFLMTDGRIRPS
jgi:ABC-type lipoprotein export system ATPase subunit